MEEIRQLDSINVTELLLQISNDVSSIKTELSNMRELQRIEKENTKRELEDIRSDYKHDLTDLEKRLQLKIDDMKKVQDNLSSKVNEVYLADERKDAKRWRTVIAYIGTAVAGMVFAKLPDFLSFLASSMTK